MKLGDNKQWQPGQNSQEKQMQPPHHQQHRQHKRQQQQRQQSSRTPRRRHQQYAERGLHSTLGSSPRPATALPWTSAQDDDYDRYNERCTNHNNYSHDYYCSYSSAEPLSSRAFPTSTPRSTASRPSQRKPPPPHPAPSSTANSWCHPSVTPRKSAGIHNAATATTSRRTTSRTGPQLNSRSRKTENNNDTIRGDSGLSISSGGGGISNEKSTKTDQQVPCSNPYRKFYANLTSAASASGNKRKTSSILAPNDTSPPSSVTPQKINAIPTGSVSLAKHCDTGGDISSRRSVRRPLSSCGTLEQGLAQSLYEDELNQVAASPIYLQLLKARSSSTRDTRDRSDCKVGAYSHNACKNSSDGATVRRRRSSLGILRPKSSYTASDNSGRNISRRSVQGFNNGKTFKRYSGSSTGQLLSGNSQCSTCSNTNEDSGGSIDNQSHSVRFYIDDEDDEEEEDDQEEEIGNYEAGEGGDEEDNNGSRDERVARGLPHQTKRGSVTFDVPDGEAESQQSVSFPGQNCSRNGDIIRRMSAPELPPIADANAKPSRVKGDKRKTSTNSVASSGSKASINQLAAAVNSKTFYNRKSTSNGTSNGVNTGGRKKKKLPIPRNHSDSSLKGLVANNSNQSQDSGGSLTEGPGGGGGAGGAGGPLRQVKFLANGHRALSWCATENSGSQTKLETLFEGQNIVSANRHNGATLSYANNNNSGSSGNLPSYVANRVESPDATCMPVIPPPRSVSVNGIRSRDEMIRLGGYTSGGGRKLHSEAGDEEIATVDDFASRSRMRRSQSENKLAGGKHLFNSTTSLNSVNNNNNSNSNNNINASSSNNNTNSNNKYNSIGSNNENKPRPTGKSKQKHTNSQRGMTRNLSVDRIDRLTSRASRKSISSNPAGAKNSHMRRVNSVSALNTANKTPYLTTLTNNNTNNNNSRVLNRNEANQEDVFDDEEDEECLEASVRLVEWLNIVNNVDEYDTDPKDTVIEYIDEPPQTDTAVHVVYGGD